MNEQALLEAARGGDEDAFARLVSSYRGMLHAHCYRMLGSAADADDALQDTLLRAWRALPNFEGRSAFSSWLYRIATNACLRLIERRPKRVLPIDYGPASSDPHDPLGAPLTESVWVEPYPDERFGLEDGFASPDARYEQRESVELAFVAALQNLPPRQRAVLILREVLGFSAEEVADVLDTTPTGVYSALQRAHKAVDERLPERSQQQTLRSLEDDDVRRLAEGFVDAWVNADVDTVVSMLAEDVAIAMPPTPTWFRGRDVVAQFLRERPLSPKVRWRGMPIRANGQLGAALYTWDDERQAYMAHDIVILTLRGDQIASIDAFLSAEPFERFGLPDSIE